MLTVENRVGRLVEARIATPVAVPDVQQFGLDLRAILQRTTGLIVICTDLREASVFPQPVADAFVGIMKNDNPRVERSAFLVRESATFGLQIERMIREANNPARRAFRDSASVGKWLGELLDPNERARVLAFLGMT